MEVIKLNNTIEGILEDSIFEKNVDDINNAKLSIELLTILQAKNCTTIILLEEATLYTSKLRFWFDARMVKLVDRYKMLAVDRMSKKVAHSSIEEERCTDTFFKSDDAKCQVCPITKSKLKVIERRKNPILAKKGLDNEVLILIDTPKSEAVVYKLVKFIESKGIKNFRLVNSLECNIESEKFPSPAYSVFSNCNIIKENRYKGYKVIIAIGKTISAITQTSDIPTWQPFAEYKFNQTFFITPYTWESKIRVYPLPELSEWLHKDTYELFFVTKQLKFINKYLDNYIKPIVAQHTTKLVDDCNEFLESHMNEPKMAWDTETNSLNHYTKGFKVGVITLTFDGLTAYYLRFKDIDKEVLTRFFATIPIQVLANFKFDSKAMHVLEVPTPNITDDILLLFRMLYSERTGNSLDALSHLVGLGGYSTPLHQYVKKWKIKNYLDIPEKLMLPYAGLDAIATFRLWELGEKLAKQQPTVHNLYKRTFLQADKVFMKAELTGLTVNTTKVQEIHLDITGRADILAIEIQEKLNQKFEVSSPEQLGRALEKDGWSAFSKSKKGVYSTKNESLVLWQKQGYELATTILKYRELMTLDKMFVGGYAEEEDGFFKSGKKRKKPIKGVIQHIQKDGKVHPRFMMQGARSGRSTGNAPNWQQLPKHSDEAKEFRSIYECPEDYLIGEFDYAGFQLRIAGAEYAKDPNMIDAFLNRGGDVHSISGHSIFASDVTLEHFINNKELKPFKTFRQWAKFVNFGFIFMRSYVSFKNDLEKAWEDEVAHNYIKDNKLILETDKNTNKPCIFLTCAKDIRKKFFETYLYIESWAKKQIAFAKEHGYIDSPFGGRRHTPFLTYIGDNDDGGRTSNYTNIAVNSNVQNFEASMIYQAMIDIDRFIVKNSMKTKFIAMIHDSLVYLIHKDEVKIMYRVIKSAMENYEYEVPFLVDASIGKVWGFGAKIESEEDLNILIAER